MTATGEREQLLQQLVANAPSFDFFQVVRLLMRGAAGEDVRRRGSDRLPVRFRGSLSFRWKASDVQAIEPPRAAGQPPTVVANFLGVATPGVPGSLPNWYAAEAQREAADREEPNAAMVDFFALFDDRLLQLYFRAWLRNNLPVQYELQKDGVVGRVLQSVVGFGTQELRRMLPLDPRALVHHAALLVRWPATPSALAESLRRWFGVPFEVEQFVEYVTELGSEQRLRLGDHTMRLGGNTVVGDSVRLRQGKFRLRAGPVGFAQFAAFLPGSDGVDDGAMLRELIALVRQATGCEFEFDLQLVLRAADVPALAFRSGEPARARLGLSTWLGTRPVAGDAIDSVVQVSVLEGRRAAARRRTDSVPRSSASPTRSP